MSKDDEFEDELNAEVVERLAIMEDPDYEYPATLGRIDWIAITVCPILCFALLVLGEFL